MAAKKSVAMKKSSAKKAAFKKKVAKKKPKQKFSDAFLQSQFKPGKSGNPNGRPKRRTMDEAMAHLLDQPIPGGDADSTRVDYIAGIILDECVQKRNPTMLKELLSRIWPVTSRIEHANNPDAPLTDAVAGIDLSKLSVPELKILGKIVTKARDAGA